jgi:error-prone DNA polymerase
MGARLIEVEGTIQSSPDHVVHLVAERLVDRSSDLMNLANDALGRKHAVPDGANVIEPLQDELPSRDASPPHKMRHPRNVRILPRSRDFH